MNPCFSSSTEGEPMSLAEVETRHIRAMLEYTGGNKAQAAARLGISPTTLWRKLKRPV